jgi:hypothetical protein
MADNGDCITLATSFDAEQQKPLSELWKMTRSTRPARTSVELTVDICAIIPKS